MNKTTMGGAIALIAGSVLWQAETVRAEDARMDEALSQAAASNDLQGVLHALPNIRPLAHRNPVEFLRLVKVGVPVLREAVSHPEAKRELYDLLADILGTACPTNIPDVTPYFEIKKEVVLEYLNLEAVRTDKAWVMGVARFVGEIRSCMIPDYRNGGTAQPGLQILLQAGVRDASALTNSVLKEAYKQARARNEQELQMNRLQSSLREVNAVMSFHVLQAAARILPTETHAGSFVDELATNGRLTKDERMKLQGISAKGIVR